MASSITSSSESNSGSTSPPTIGNQLVQQLDKRLWRAIDFLHLLVMVFSLYTAIIVAILRHELFEQCPLYAKLYLRDNATQFSTDTIDRQTVWGSVYTCEFASFAYLSAFALSFISLWIHIVFRRVLRTERLLRLPIGVLTLLFALLTLTATILVTDGVIKFCSGSQSIICSSAGGEIFSQSRWKVFSLPAGGWLSSLSILLNTLARIVQLVAKPKKSPETLKVLLNQLMLQRHQQKAEKESSDYGSQISQSSRDRTRPRTSTRRDSADHVHHREFSPELYPYYYPPVPQYRRIEKRSRFQRLCCPCFRRRRRRQLRSVPELYRPYVVPEEYFHRLDHLKQNGATSPNLCHRHSIHHPVEEHTQMDAARQRKSIDQTPTETPFLGRRRSSVRFEDEIPTLSSAKEVSVPVKEEATPTAERKDEQIVDSASDNDLQRNVSFRNNEDDLWTTVTINTKQSAPIQSSHFNRLSLENLSRINTSVSNNDNGVTAIQISSVSNEPPPTETFPKEIPLPPPLLLPQPSSHASRSRSKPLPPPPQTLTKPVRSRYKPPSSRGFTTSSEDDTDLRNIKPVEEINTLVATKYNYNDVSEALKSNVERLRCTFIHVQESQSHYDKPKTFRPNLFHKSFPQASTPPHSSDC